MKIRPIERRYTSGEVEVRQRGSETVIEGHAAVFEKLSQNLGGFVERVMPGAFTKTLQEADVRALYNHDENLVLGRNKAGTLELSEDDTGLYYRITPPNTTYARDLMTVIERGDVSQSSFAFMAIDEEWGFSEQDFPRRDLLQVHLVDVSPVTYAAYLDTDVSSGGRSMALHGLSKRTGVPVADLSDPEAIREALRRSQADAPDGNEDTHTDDEPDASTHRRSVWAKRASALAELESSLNDSADS
jgi:HK97 family phage prohead protease